jgi:hypothetical protein
MALTYLYWALLRPFASILAMLASLQQYFLAPTKAPLTLLTDSLRDAKLFEEWEAAALQLDTELGSEAWYV